MKKDYNLLKFLFSFFLVMTIFNGNSQTTDFVITVKTDNPGASGANQFTIPCNVALYSYSYNVNWGDATTSTAVSSNITHTYATAGTYTIRISGTFPAIYFNDQYSNSWGDRGKILAVNQWGSSMNWKSFAYAFAWCINLEIVATDLPNLTSVYDMSNMFEGCSHLYGNTSLNFWNTSSVKIMKSMFEGASHFNQDISSWNTSSVKNMSRMFRNAKAFNQNISSWNTSAVTDMSGMFYGTDVFNQDISALNTAAVTTMVEMFAYTTSFNQNLNGWNTSSVTDMSYMFTMATSFNGKIDEWNTSAVTNMNSMFNSATGFNQSLNTWNTLSVKNMNRMFSRAGGFNGDISSWNTSSVTTMEEMFRYASQFNSNISGWNTGAVTNMAGMFYEANQFRRSLGNWNISAVTNFKDFLSNCGMFMEHYDSTLIGWNNSGQHFASGEFGAENRRYCKGAAARSNLINNGNFQPKGDYLDCLEFFKMTILTNNYPILGANQFTIPVRDDIYSYSYNVDWGDGTTSSGVTSSITHTYTYIYAKEYTIIISGIFPAIYFNNVGDKDKVRKIQRWGSGMNWQSFENSFYGCKNLDVQTSDVPILTSVSNISGMFKYCNLYASYSNFNSWNTSSVTKMDSVFYSARNFEGPLGNWNINSVTTMNGFLSECGMRAAFYDSTLNGWNASGQNPIATSFGASGLKYCNAASARANLIAISNFTPVGDHFDCNALPLKLLSFTSTKQNFYNNLQWKTESEINTKKFIVEKSKDGRTFNSIAEVMAEGSGSNIYNYKDLIIDGIVYYRLKMLDIDGSFTYSIIIHVDNTQIKKARIYPNAVTNNFILSVDADLINTEALLLDAKGMVLQKIRITNSQQQVNTNGLPAGIYLLKLKIGEVIKVIKN